LPSPRQRADFQRLSSYQYLLAQSQFLRISYSLKASAEERVTVDMQVEGCKLRNDFFSDIQKKSRGKWNKSRDGTVPFFSFSKLPETL
jgi:hypothetical protein